MKRPGARVRTIDQQPCSYAAGCPTRNDSCARCPTTVLSEGDAHDNSHHDGEADTGSYGTGNLNGGSEGASTVASDPRDTAKANNGTDDTNNAS